jgi:3-methyladenine DNA glycosylase AlkC
MTQSSETSEQTSQRKLSDASAYSAHVQEAMRFNKLSSSHYALVMTLLDAVLRGYTEERWKTEQQRTVTALTKQSPDESVPYSDATNRYEQSIKYLKDLTLWPW